MLGPAWMRSSRPGRSAATKSFATVCSEKASVSGPPSCSPRTKRWEEREGKAWESSPRPSRSCTRTPWCTTISPAWTTTICGAAGRRPIVPSMCRARRALVTRWWRSRRACSRTASTRCGSTRAGNEIALELFRAAGAGGMIGGQALDLVAEAKALPVAALEEVHARKTGALIAASCVIGGLSAASAPSHIEGLRAYGEAIGLAFQIADDVLDATATSDQLGKTAGKDAAHAKATFVTLLGVGAARAEAERLAAKAVDHLRDAGLVSPILVELSHYIVTRPN